MDYEPVAPRLFLDLVFVILCRQRIAGTMATSGLPRDKGFLRD